MTHEQKPESAEFRTREDLLPCPFCGASAQRIDFDDGENIGGSCISCTRCGASGHVEFGFKENFVSQWNTRVSNAAEQRRKDAEGAEPVAWQYEVKGLGEWQNGEFGYGPDVWRLKCGYIKPDRDDPDYRSLSPLYDHPANVAALEARVKELEGAITALFDGQACFENLGFEDPPLRVVVYDDEQVATGKDPIGVAVTGAKVIAAAIREGGEHEGV